MEQGSRQERRHAERQRRKEQNQKEKERRKGKKQLQRFLSYSIGILLLAGAGYWAYTNWATTPAGDFIRSMGNRHLTSSQVGLTTYNSDPPTSGPHLPSVARWVLFTQWVESGAWLEPFSPRTSGAFVIEVG